MRILWAARTHDRPDLDQYNRLMRQYLIVSYGAFGLLIGLS